MKIFVCLPLTKAQLGRLAAGAGAAEILYHPNADSDDTARADFEASEITFGNPPAAWIGPTARTRWVQLESVGFGEYAGLNWSALCGTPVMTNLAGFFSGPVAESILAGLLSHCRGMGKLRSLQDQRQWQGGAIRATLTTLTGARVVLLGRGDINRRVAELLQPFRCRIVEFGRDFDPGMLDSALATADVVICCVPHTPQTSGLFHRQRIGLMKPGALFVNFGRGSLVDEEALAEALEAGALGGAVIDVTREEPLSADHRFWSAPNLLLTQHSGGGTADEIDRKIDVFLANLDCYRMGEPLLHQIDFVRGY